VNCFALAILISAGVLISAVGCSDCRARTDAADAAPSADASHQLRIEPPPLAPLVWEAQNDSRGIGVPAGCRPLLPIFHAKLPAQKVRFASARSDLKELAVAFGAPGNPRTAQSGLIEISSPKVRSLPWFELDRPPAFDRAATGWVAAFTRQEEHGKASAVLWTEAGRTLPLSHGDQLTVVDVLCHGETCAVLSTLARAAAAPGATLHLGAPGSKYTQVDIEADPAVPWQPLAITAFDGSEARVALKAPDAVAIWSVTARSPTKLSEVKAEFGVYDALATKDTLIVAPGAHADEPCKAEQFPIRIIDNKGKVQLARSQAAPYSLVIRPLDRRALMLWVAPISCARTDRTLVHAALVDADGSKVGSVMSVADAQGFAVATRGSEFALWLRTEQGLSYVRAECAPPSP
jgi:hypothetical protein